MRWTPNLAVRVVTLLTLGHWVVLSHMHRPEGGGRSVLEDTNIEIIEYVTHYLDFAALTPKQVLVNNQ